jgi:hypothetical protein
MNENCVFCGTPKDRHYDGVQCPMGADTWSSTQKFTPDSTDPKEKAMTKDQAEDLTSHINRMAETNIAAWKAAEEARKAQRDLDSFIHSLQYPPKEV